MRRHYVWGFLLAGGCAQIAGIDKTTGPTESDDVSLAISRYSIGVKIVTTPLDLSTLTAQFLVSDDEDPSGFQRVPAELDENVWHAEIPDIIPAAYFTQPDYPEPYYRLLDGIDRNIQTLFGSLEHPNETPALAGSMIKFAVTLDKPYAAATESLQLFTIGAWSQHQITADAPLEGDPAIVGSFDYSTAATSLTGRPLAAITTDDVPLVLKYVAGTLVGSFEAPSFMQTAGTDTITGTMATVTADQTIATPVAPMAIQTRFAAGRPAVGGFSLNWQVTAAPGFAVGQPMGPRLAGANVPLADTMIAASYGNPFVAHNWQSMFALTASTSRTYTSPMPEALNLTLSATLTSYSAGSAIDTTIPAPLPVLISVNGSTVSTDGIDLPLVLSKAVNVSFVADTATATLYQLALLEVVPTGTPATALKMVPRVLVTGVKPAFKLPPELFLADHRYVLRASCITGGYPGAPTGDLTMRSLPISQGSFDSGVFTVKVMQ